MNNALLNNVARPARYTGGEWNSVQKKWDDIKVKVALAFPDVYEVGMSNMAIPILYELLNEIPDVLAERVFAPWPDMEEQLRQHGERLYSLETHHPLHQFDIIGFSLGYELCYTTVLNMLDLAGLPVFAGERRGVCPLIIAGGSCAMNPEPMSDFIDVFFAGEAEDAINEIINTWRKYRYDRGELLRKLSLCRGIYVPSFYSPVYNLDGTIRDITRVENNAPETVERVIAAELKPATKPVVPYIEVIHDRAAVEIQRGCSRGCRFCQAGILYRPVRELSEDRVLNTIDCLLANTGHSTLSLVSLSSGDHSSIGSIVRTISSKYAKSGVTVSLPSLRLDKTSIDLIEALPSGRKTTLTFAPEAGSERMRRAINKWIPHQSMMDTFASAFEKDWMNLKLYFMIGLPSETLDDVAAIATLVNDICKLGKYTRGRLPRVRVSVSSFVPKPHTPCQWSSQDGEESLTVKHNLLRNQLKRGNVQLSWNDPRTSLLEAVLSRGNRRLGKVIYTAWRKGCRLDTWSEYLDHCKWQQAFDECGINPSFYAHRERDVEEILPWQRISPVVSGAYLINERKRIFSGDLTGDCRNHDCNLCGVQSRCADCRQKAQNLSETRKIIDLPVDRN